MKKVLVIEDEYEQVRTAFSFVNTIYLNDQLEIKKVEKAQQIPFDTLMAYDYIFLDITLAKGSSMDGYGILLKIEKDHIPIHKLIILTGNNKVKEMLKDKGIKGTYRIITKPIDFNDLKKVFE